MAAYCVVVEHDGWQEFVFEERYASERLAKAAAQMLREDNGAYRLGYSVRKVG